MAITRHVDFWFDFASTYSYLSAMRIDAMARKYGVLVRWSPFLLGPIFNGQGWTTSPFNLYPAKGRYMLRDMGRIAAERGLPFHMPDPFPQHSLLAARTALAITDNTSRAAFAHAVFIAQFADLADISSRDVIARCLVVASVATDDVLALANSDATKQALRDATATATRIGIFGAPTFVTSDGELYWGDDRLEAALRHAGGLTADAR